MKCVECKRFNECRGVMQIGTDCFIPKEKEIDPDDNVDAFRLDYCPFCGSDNVTAEISFLTKEFRIYCCDGEGCTAEMSLSFADAGLGDGSFISFYEADKIMKDLIAAWNRRADDGN